MLQFRKKTNDDYSEFYESVSYIEGEKKEKFFSFYSSKKNMFIFSNRLFKILLKLIFVFFFHKETKITFSLNHLKQVYSMYVYFFFGREYIHLYLKLYYEITTFIYIYI
jgi:hypothetical protein